MLSQDTLPLPTDHKVHPRLSPFAMLAAPGNPYGIPDGFMGTRRGLYHHPHLRRQGRIGGIDQSRLRLPQLYPGQDLTHVLSQQYPARQGRP